MLTVLMPMRVADPEEKIREAQEEDDLDEEELRERIDAELNEEDLPDPVDEKEPDAA